MLCVIAMLYSLDWEVCVCVRVCAFVCPWVLERRILDKSLIRFVQKYSYMPCTPFPRQFITVHQFAKKTELNQNTK